MKNSLLFTLVLAGLVLSGCNSSTRSNTATDSMTPSSTPAPVAIDQTPSPSDTSSASASTSPADATSAGSVSSSTSGTGSIYSGTSSASASSSTDPTRSTDPSRSTDYSSPSTSPSVPSSPTAIDPSTSTTATVGATSRSTEPVSSPTVDVASRISEWRLSGAEIQSDLDSGMTIVRTKDTLAGAPVGATDNEVTKTIVIGKLQADKETSKGTFDVKANNGEIMLKGTADSAATVGRAIALALDTQGVSKVSSDVKISSSSNP